jgi:2-dehydropantoate 2-reductase
VDDILDTVSEKFMHPDTLTTILQDWRKGRRAEIHDINGFVVETLARHGRKAPVNARIVEVAQAIETGEIAAGAENLARLTGEMSAG